jgi:2-methylcitrate dehydratase PrpD
VEVVEDPDFTRAFPQRQPTEVTVVLADRTELSERADFHRGEADRDGRQQARATGDRAVWRSG